VAFTFSNGEQAELSVEDGEAVASEDVHVASTSELDSLFTEYQTYLNETEPMPIPYEEGSFSSFSAGLNNHQKCKFWQIGCWKRKLIDPRWPDRTVYFNFHRNVGATDRQTIRNLVSDWNSRSSVQWIEDGSRFLKVTFKLKNFRGNVCGDSPVGRIGVPQLIRLRPDCVTQRTVQHEMGHAIGLIHEHQRCDRDNYVSVSSNDSNNRKECAAKYSIFGPYDYSSLMHYRAATAVSPQPNGSVGDTWSPGGNFLGCYDRLGINKLYGAYGWSSMASSSPTKVEWLQFQFPSQRRVSRVDMYPRNDATYGSSVGDGFPVDFTIDVSNDGVSWSTVLSRTGYPRPTSVQTFEFTAQPARYLRIRATTLRSVGGGSYYFQIAEVETF
jgi:hypothetical protein